MRVISESERAQIWDAAAKAEAIHIGYHKTATTYLTGDIFPQFNLGERFFNNDLLSGDIVLYDALDSAERIARLNPSARILITIRAQDSMLRSAYWLYVKSGGSGSLADYVDIAIRNGKFQYFAMYESYIAHFQHVHVMCVEDLRRDPIETLNTLQQFLGTSVDLDLDRKSANESPSDLHILFVRLANCLLGRAKDESNIGYGLVCCRLPFLWSAIVINRLKRAITGTPFQFYDIAPHREKIRAAYAEGNRRLFAALGRDPADLGYPI